LFSVLVDSYFVPSICRRICAKEFLIASMGWHYSWFMCWFDWILRFKNILQFKSFNLADKTVDASRADDSFLLAVLPVVFKVSPRAPHLEEFKISHFGQAKRWLLVILIPPLILTLIKFEDSNESA
jgi:hypothetical protein